MELFTLVTAAASSVLFYLYVYGVFTPSRGFRFKNVVITGASSGIGKETAYEFARLGSNLVLTARRGELLEQVANDCRAINKSIKVITVAGDITEDSVQRKILADSLSAFNTIDFLVLNAGTISVTNIETLLGIKKLNPPAFLLPLPDVPALNKALDKIMALNFHAPVSLSSYFLPSLISSQGSIIVVSSMAGFIGAPTRSLYSASKFALNGYFHSLRMEMSRRNVNVSIVCPGTVDTQLRLSAVDLVPNSSESAGSSSPQMDNLSGSKSGKISPLDCAKHIIHAAKYNLDVSCFPLKFKISVYLNTFFPKLVDYFAKKKYGY
ncbi:Hydroxysteroid 11-beta-dehydrogenase 1-like protein A [Smittium mucronatum]|uniref:Hydroxysteroid 11-beta-dehydrogenase 1-like protein A n=1 Tax=Smittium mucronatum TaxID=133383 RepID=A0A1R0H8T6_9FUNG|nr:Hydroxysteroid 11-beta-dehydrogenase 1-like protein A [Smittium mucronatum]